MKTLEIYFKIHYCGLSPSAIIKTTLSVVLIICDGDKLLIL